jgi:hypothetical protein
MELQGKCGGLAGKNGGLARKMSRTDRKISRTCTENVVDWQGIMWRTGREKWQINREILTQAGKLWLSGLGKYSRLLGKIWQTGRKNTAERQDVNEKT